MPSEAITEPIGLAFKIMELRAYARAKDAVDRADKPEDIPDSPMIDMVFAVQKQLLDERKERLKSGRKP